MLQVIVKKGRVLTREVPDPSVSEGCVLIRVVNSCISAGTETAGVRDSGKSILEKALEKPQNVKRAASMAMADGLATTIERVRNKLGADRPTGYSVAGVAIAVGPNVTRIQVGDRVAAAGAGHANHAEVVSVPENLVMPIPEKLGFPEASTVTLGGIALQGVRRADLRLGEFCVVVGAGILGLLTIQLLKASGVRVLALDLDESRLRLATSYGADAVCAPGRENALSIAAAMSGGHGADAVIFTAASSSAEPLSDSFKMCKKKGRVVLVGTTGMEIRREDIFEKELDFLISTSYGPGRYDRNYEEKGLDYPFGYVRWTENRNMEAYLRLLDEKKISVDAMISGHYPVANASDAFAALQSDPRDGVPRPLMILLDYETATEKVAASARKQIPVRDPSIIGVSVIGAGGFATGVHLPNLKSLSDKFKIRGIVNRNGLKCRQVAEQFGAAIASSDVEDVLKDPETDLVMIATRHASHAGLALRALRAGKHVFVEKPLAIQNEELLEIEEFYQTKPEEPKPLLMTGFNRRFSSYAREIKSHVGQRSGPVVLNYTMNAGFIALDHWVHDDGGRIIGEACHIIDLFRYLVGSSIVSVSSEAITARTDQISSTDNRSMTLKFADGSIAHLMYTSIGSSGYPKERMEVFFDQKTIVLNDYKSLRGFGIKIREIESRESDKGQRDELVALYQALKGANPHEWPIPLNEMLEVTRATFLLSSSV